MFCVLRIIVILPFPLLLGDVINFAIKYSLQCLSVSSHFSPPPATPLAQNLVTSLSKLLEDNFVEELFSHANEYNKISSQQEMLNIQTNHMLKKYQQLGDGQSPISPVSARMSELPVVTTQGGGVGGSGGNDVVDQDITPQQEQHLQSSGVPGGVPKLPAPPNFPMMVHQGPPPPPFMLPPHGHMPMYYPIMPMPPPAAMGYMPFMMPPPPPPPSLHQVVTPLPGVGDIVVQDSPEGASGSTIIPNSTYQEWLVQEQGVHEGVDDNGGGNLTTVSPDQSMPAPPSNPPQSEMVASVYPIPSSAMIHTVPPPPPPSSTPATSESISMALLPSSENQSTLPQLQVDDNRPGLPPSKDDPPSTLDVTVVGGDHAKEIPETPKLYSTNTDKPSTSFKKPKPSSDQPCNQQGQRNSRHSSQTSNPPDTFVPSNVGLEQTNSQPPRRKYPQTRGQVDGNSRRGGGAGGTRKSELVANSETNHRMVNSKRSGFTETDGGGGVEKKEHSSRERNQQRSNNKSNSGKKRYSSGGGGGRDHSGTSTVAGPSQTSRKSNQDHNRAFSCVYDRNDDDNGKDGAATRTARLDTMGFQWGVPSPSGQSDVITCYTPRENRSNLSNTSSPHVEKTEWPDFSESSKNTGQPPIPASKRESYSVGLKFVFDGVNECPERDDFSAVTITGRYQGSNNEFTETVEDPFDIDDGGGLLHGAWNSDVGDFPVSLSTSSPLLLQLTSSQSPQFQGIPLHAQCTGDLPSEER